MVIVLYRYMLRAVYVVKGSKLLPPTFASIFDYSALSSLDIFFDPSDGSISLPGVTMGMFKFISKGIKSKGYGTKRYLGDIGKTVERAGSKALFAVVTEISDSVLRGAETNGFNGMVKGFHQGILRLAMEPSVLGLAIVDGGPDQKIKLVRSPGLDELYIEGYLQGMLDVSFKLEYLRLLHKEATKAAGKLTSKGRKLIGDGREKPQGGKIWVVGGFLLSGVVAYVDGRLCRHIPNPIARHIVSGFLLIFLDRKDSQQS